MTVDTATTQTQVYLYVNVFAYVNVYIFLKRIIKEADLKQQNGDLKYLLASTS